jgi:hypothetical protein
VGPRATLDPMEKRKFLHCRELNPGRQAHSEQGDSQLIMPATAWISSATNVVMLVLCLGSLI